MGILKKFQNLFKKERAYSTYSIQAMFEEKLSDVMYATGEYCYVINHFVGDGEQYLIFIREGKYYRTDVSISGDEVTFSEPYEVVVEYTAIGRENVNTSIYRDKDGKLKFVAVASYATINRSDEIDTTSLFDSFEETYGLYVEEPIFNLGHIHNEKFNIGIVEGVFRYLNTLVAYGNIDETTPLGSKVEERIKSGDWGLSIEFVPLKMEREQIDGKEITKYTKGYFAGLALLRENNAASYFTKIEVTRNMGKDREKAKNILKDFLGNEAEAETFMGDVELREKQAKENGVIVRDGEKEVETEIVDLEITDEVMDELVNKASEKAIASVQDILNKFNEQVVELRTKLDETEKINRELSEKISKIQVADEKKVEDAVGKLPQNRQTINITRKTEERQKNLGQKLSLEQIAEDPAAVRAERLSRLKQSKTGVINSGNKVE